MRCTACGDDSRAGDPYGYGHGEPVAAEPEMPVDDNGLTVRLPASTRIRLTLRLEPRTRTPGPHTPFALGPAGGGSTT